MLAIVVAAVALQRLIGPDPSPPGAELTVIDGDTVRAAGAVYRLLGFDAPERGDRAFATGSASSRNAPRPGCKA